MGDQLAVILSNLNTELKPAIEMLSAVSLIAGIVFVAFGLLALKRGGPGEKPVGSGLASIAIGAILISVRGFIDHASYSMFAEQAAVFGAAQSGGSMGAYITFAITVVHIVGFYCVIKGLIKLKHSGDGRGESSWSGFTHIIGGIICCNITAFVRIIGNSAGGVVQQVVQQILK